VSIMLRTKWLPRMFGSMRKFRQHKANRFHLQSTILAIKYSLPIEKKIPFTLKEATIISIDSTILRYDVQFTESSKIKKGIYEESLSRTNPPLLHQVLIQKFNLWELVEKPPPPVEVDPPPPRNPLTSLPADVIVAQLVTPLQKLRPQKDHTVLLCQQCKREFIFPGPTQKQIQFGGVKVCCVNCLQVWKIVFHRTGPPGMFKL